MTAQANTDKRKPLMPWWWLAGVVVFATVFSLGFLIAMRSEAQSAEEEAQRTLRWIRLGQEMYIADTGQAAERAEQLAQDSHYLSLTHAALFQEPLPDGSTRPWPIGQQFQFQFRILGRALAPGGIQLVPGTQNRQVKPVWGVIGRPRTPGDNQHQLLMLPGGRVFRHAAPPAGDPRAEQYLLDQVPALDANGHIDEAALVQAGWQFVRVLAPAGQKDSDEGAVAGAAKADAGAKP